MGWAGSPSAAGPEDDTPLVEGRDEAVLEIPPEDRHAHLVRNAVDGGGPVGEGDEGGAHRAVALEHGDDLALRGRALDEGDLLVAHRAAAIEEVVEDGVVGEVEP